MNLDGYQWHHSPGWFELRNGPKRDDVAPLAIVMLLDDGRWHSSPPLIPPVRGPGWEPVMAEVSRRLEAVE